MDWYPLLTNGGDTLKGYPCFYSCMLVAKGVSKESGVEGQLILSFSYYCMLYP